MKSTSNCKHPEQHHQHLCEMSKRLDKKALATYTRDPHYVCANCGGRTREGKHLCDPRRLKR